MKVALIYDRVNKFGGAERVLLALHKIYPEAPLYTLVYDPKSTSWANVFNVIPTFINKYKFFRSKHELLAPIAALAFESLDLRRYDVVISVTSGDAKAVITKPNQLHICYCLTPTRYFWSGENQYNKDLKMKLISKRLIDYFRTTDLLISKRPDWYIAISKEVKSRISKYYHRQSTVIYPPIDDIFYSNDFTPINKRNHYLIVNRLVPYKMVDLAIRVFNTLKKPLIVVGTGSEFGRLKQIAGETIQFMGSVDDDKLVKLYKNAKAVVFPQEEDFGLVPIEAQACGTPVIAYEKGGALETVINNQTGVFFNEQTEDSLIKATIKLDKLSINPKNCYKNALKYNSNNFEKKFSEKVRDLWSNHLANSAA